MCLSVGPSSYHSLLHSEIPCKVIYSKAFGNGILYALVLSKQTAHATLDRRVVDLDRMLMRAGGDSSTRFTSVSDVMDGKVKTFGVREHVIDEHFRAIFTSGTPGGGRELLVHPDVERWDPPRVIVVHTGVTSDGNGGHAVDGDGLIGEDQNQVLLEKTVMKLKARISTYNKIFSVTGKNIARLKLAAVKSEDELSSKVHTLRLCYYLLAVFLFIRGYVVQASAIGVLTAENASKTQEIETLTASISAKDATIARVV